MREYPIIFSAQMIPPLIDGRKRVTRRLSKQWLKVRAGDRLWVREMTESYPLPNLLTGEPTNSICGRYSADHEPVLDEHEFDIAWWYSKPVCPSIHMPRWASRILLECEEDARPERLQDITPEEVCAEGVALKHAELFTCRENTPSRDALIIAFAELWRMIHAKPGERWEENPEVVRLGRFRRV